MATWWQDRGKLLPDLIKIPTHPGHGTEDEPENPTEDIGHVSDDQSDELDDVEPPDRGADE